MTNLLLEEVNEYRYVDHKNRQGKSDARITKKVGQRMANYAHAYYIQELYPDVAETLFV